MRRKLQWQGYVAHTIGGKALVRMETDPYRCPLLPVHRVQDCQFPLVIKLHELSEEPLRGYMAACTAFGIARALFTTDNTALGGLHCWYQVSLW